MQVWLLGGFRISIGSRNIENHQWRLKKAAALVKLLALAPNHRLTREQAMDLLWPVSSRKTVSNNLRHTLHAARKTLDPASGFHYLTSEDESLVLCPGGSLWVDVEVFEEAASTARYSRDPAAYRAAIDLYAGELLPEDRYEGWAEGRREELRQLYLVLLIEIAGLYEERDEHRPAIEALRKATEEEPTNEEAYAALMRLHTLSGHPEQALAHYERLRETLSRGPGTQPSPTIRRLRDEIAVGKFSSASPAAPSQREEASDTDRHNLPAPRTSFVGREREMVEVKRTLAMTRLLTLTGAGGSGKTRLALEVAGDLVGVYPDGVWLVEFAPLSEPELVTQVVAEALKVPEHPGQSLTDTLMGALRIKRMLLVLDNCEHLVDAVARLVDDLLRSCPNLRLLATSRESLGVSGEVNWPVPPLSLPDAGRVTTVEELEGYGSARLFVERALYRPSAFVLTPENAGAVAGVCRQLEGIPLAIELAAARVGVLAVEQISERLSDSLRFLTSGGRTLTARQRTLRGSLDWSHELLSKPERKLFGRLSTFVGGWTLETAEEVCSGDGIEKEEVLDLLSGLVDKSLVIVGASINGATRYRMLELIRQYAREKLEDNGEAEETRKQHTAFFLALAEEAGPELAGSQQGLWVERMEEEHDNLRAAISWVLDRKETELGLRFGGALWRFWFVRSYMSEGLRWLEEILANNDPVPERAKVLEGMGWLAQHQGDVGRAEATYEEMRKLSRELGDKESAATALNSLGTLAVARGDNERARSLLGENLAVLRELEEEGSNTTIKRFYVFNLLGILAINQEEDYVRGITSWEESLALAREAGDTFHVGTTLSNLGYATLMQGNHERATSLCEDALAVAHGLGSAGDEIVPETLVNLGLAALAHGDHERAMASLRKALVIGRNAGRKPTVINALEGIVSLTGALEEDIRAARLWGAAEALREVTGIALPPGELAFHEPYLAGTRSRMGETAWEEALAEGRAMSLEDASEYALSKATDQPEATTSQKPSIHEPTGNLTRREREVAILVAQGLTNRQISTNLSISERTVGNHVARILRKLGLRSRVRIATWTEHHLLTSNAD